MHEAARTRYATLDRIGDAHINAALLAQLDKKIASGMASDDGHMMRANLLRRSGRIADAREAIRAHLAIDTMPEFLAVPPGLNSENATSVAPLIVIDDLLPRDEMEALYRHACSLETKFGKAGISRRGGPYDPEKRETLWTANFEVKRQFFLDFIASNLARFQSALHMPAFTIEKSGIKLTNHVDGGFFNLHRDNLEGPNDAGRAITWLYYFGADPSRFSGGELFIFDSDPANGKAAENFFTKVVPQPNRFVAFPSWYFHAVGPTRVPGNRFADGRFAVSGHLWKPADTLEWTYP